MDDLKQLLERKLIANEIVAKCMDAAASGRLFFRDAWCTQERVIRFTTPFFRDLFEVSESGKGKWKTGDVVMYEAENSGTDSFVVNCVLSTAGAVYDAAGSIDRIMRASGASRTYGAPDTVLKRWDLSRSDGDANRLFKDFEDLIERVIPKFEDELRKRMAEEPDPGFSEGDPLYEKALRYERNRAARAACIAAHGTACAVCGMDFSKTYGPEFAGKIEVHHLMPLNTIREEYVVDPVRDMVPVCPNCHTALHSKKGGVYTIEELKAKRSKTIE